MARRLISHSISTTNWVKCGIVAMTHSIASYSLMYRCGSPWYVRKVINNLAWLIIISFGFLLKWIVIVIIKVNKFNILWVHCNIGWRWIWNIDTSNFRILTRYQESKGRDSIDNTSIEAKSRNLATDQVPTFHDNSALIHNLNNYDNYERT